MKLPAITYTFLNNVENCPRKAHHIHVLKDLPKEDSQAMRWGIAVHNAFEQRLEKNVPLPPEMPYEKFCTPIQAKPYNVEMKLAIRADGTPCDFFNPGVWARGKADVVVYGDPELRCVLLDWKTGKKREDPGELEMHAMMFQRRHPQYKTIVGHYVWLKDGEIGKQHDLSDGAGKLEEVRARVAEMQKHADVGFWPPRQNPLCGWCPVKSCEFNSSGAR